MASDPSAETRTAAIDAFLGLLAQYDYDDVSLGMIAGRAGVSLAALREAFDGKLAILAAFSRQIDAAVLAGIDPNMADEPPRERLFDTVMRRFDALQPHRAAIASLERAFRDRPGLALAFWPVALRSARWMLSAAEIEIGGTRGEIAARGLVLALGRTARAWLDDGDPGMARTMAELDKRLRDAERTMRRIDDAARLLSPVRTLATRLFRGRSRRRTAEAPPVEAAETPRPTAH